MRKSSEERKFFTVRDLVLLTGLSHDTFYRRVKDGTLPAVRLGSRGKLLIPAEALQGVFGRDGAAGGESSDAAK
ncbi:MAG: helix-turn-helix transcriptional regulator [Thermacetogeniaceae bacterium]